MTTVSMDPTRRDVVVGLLVGAAALAGPAKAFASPEIAETVSGPHAGDLGSRYVIAPSIDCCERYARTAEENTYTVVYEVMDRFDFENRTVQRALVSSDLYREWLRDHPTKDGIPPHIHFGGAVVTDRKGDPTFRDRWARRTLERLRTGELA